MALMTNLEVQVVSAEERTECYRKVDDELELKWGMKEQSARVHKGKTSSRDDDDEYELEDDETDDETDEEEEGEEDGEEPEVEDVSREVRTS